MQVRFFILFITLFVLAAFNVIINSGCANIIPPSGGPRDSIPPVPLKFTPSDSTLHFNGKHITITFNEYINLQNVREQMIISPVYKVFPEVNFKLNTLTIRLKDSLEPNTTYSFNFGNSLLDNNEGNILKNFTYIFSTGNEIDSLMLQGKVILAETGKVDTTLIVALYNNGADSAVMKERPRFMARQNGKGSFAFKNLPAGTFYLYAFKDGGSLRFTDTTQLFAFAGEPVITNQNNDSLILYAYASEKVATVTAPAGVSMRKQVGAAEKRLRFQTNLVNEKQDLLNPLSLSFDIPLRSFDSSKISFCTDSAYTVLSNYTFRKDSTGKKIDLVYTWKENTLYHLILDKDFAEDTTGKKLLKTDTITFTTRKINDYGKLSIRFRNLDLTKNPVLMLIQGDAIKGTYPLSSATFSQNLFLPGEYELRILEDRNKNGKWDPGVFFGKHIQPEIVRPVSRKITVKPDYENEFDIDAPSASQ
ncbi:MAG: Ig-like domain-containing protein [Bacteroidetes bacterium]|nr:Ig-like domain-containing protein [Bacteroidota bacterium]MBS1634015.1 Ig-like domain-containing protein [Bacteroidota bacterium]